VVPHLFGVQDKQPQKPQQEQYQGDTDYHRKVGGQQSSFLIFLE